jgi:membrane fusion protein, copper/silver efflux system
MKKVKWILPTMLVMALAVLVLGVTSCTKSEHEHSGGSAAARYTCPMHPEVVQDKAGKCPKCGMELVEKH